MEVDFSVINWFELEDGDYICIQQEAIKEDEFDEIIMTRECALELAYKIIEALEIK